MQVYVDRFHVLCVLAPSVSGPGRHSALVDWVHVGSARVKDSLLLGRTASVKNSASLRRRGGGVPALRGDRLCLGGMWPAGRKWVCLENLKESQEKWDCLTPEAGLPNGASSAPMEWRAHRVEGENSDLGLFSSYWLHLSWDILPSSDGCKNVKNIYSLSLLS